jgi:hypothetical protein
MQLFPKNVSTTKLKLLFTCPHGGKEELDIERNIKNLPSSCDRNEFNNENEIQTIELTKSIFKNIESLSRKQPHMVIALHDRKFVDFNREELCAFEPLSLDAKEKYMAYHNDILLKIDEMLPQNENGIAFLFDIHGTARVDDDHGNFFEAIIGTDEGRSIQALNAVDPKAFWGDNGLIPLLTTKKDIRIIPRDHDEKIDGHLLDGGYTIQKYGSDQLRPGLVAIQIEVIHSIRAGKYCREKFAADMADCIWNFVSPFI